MSSKELKRFLLLRYGFLDLRTFQIQLLGFNSFFFTSGGSAWSTQGFIRFLITLIGWTSFRGTLTRAMTFTLTRPLNIIAIDLSRSSIV